MFGFYINRPIAIASYIASIDPLLLSLSEKSLHKANDVTAVNDAAAANDAADRL